jgi:hypothetical protein
MNKFEEYISKALQKQSMFTHEGYRIYTVQEALDLVATLPGRLGTIEERRNWIRMVALASSGPIGFAATPNGLSVVHMGEL